MKTNEAEGLDYEQGKAIIGEILMALEDLYDLYDRNADTLKSHSFSSEDFGIHKEFLNSISNNKELLVALVQETKKNELTPKIFTDLFNDSVSSSNAVVKMDEQAAKAILDSCKDEFGLYVYNGEIRSNNGTYLRGEEISPIEIVRAANIARGEKAALHKDAKVALIWESLGQTGGYEAKKTLVTVWLSEVFEWYKNGAEEDFEYDFIKSVESNKNWKKLNTDEDLKIAKTLYRYVSAHHDDHFDSKYMAGEGEYYIDPDVIEEVLNKSETEIFHSKIKKQLETNLCETSVEPFSITFSCQFDTELTKEIVKGMKAGNNPLNNYGYGDISQIRIRINPEKKEIIEASFSSGEPLNFTSAGHDGKTGVFWLGQINDNGMYDKPVPKQIEFLYEKLKENAFKKINEKYPTIDSRNIDIEEFSKEYFDKNPYYMVYENVLGTHHNLYVYSKPQLLFLEKVHNEDRLSSIPKLGSENGWESYIDSSANDTSYIKRISSLSELRDFWAGKDSIEEIKEENELNGRKENFYTVGCSERGIFGEYYPVEQAAMLGRLFKDESLGQLFEAEEINKNIDNNLKKIISSEKAVEIHPYSRNSEDIKAVLNWLENNSPLADEITITEEDAKSVIDNIGVEGEDYLEIKGNYGELGYRHPESEFSSVTKGFAQIIDNIFDIASDHYAAAGEESVQEKDYEKIKNLDGANKAWTESQWHKVTSIDLDEDETIYVLNVPMKYAKLYGINKLQDNESLYLYMKFVKKDGLIISHAEDDFEVAIVQNNDFLNEKRIDCPALIDNVSIGDIIFGHPMNFSDEFIIRHTNFNRIGKYEKAEWFNSPLSDKRKNNISAFTEFLNEEIHKVCSDKNPLKNYNINEREAEAILHSYSEADMYVGKIDGRLAVAASPLVHNHTIKGDFKDFRNKNIEYINIYDFIENSKNIIKILSLSDDNRNYSEEDELMIETIDYYVNHSMAQRVFNFSSLKNKLNITERQAEILLTTLNIDCDRNIIADLIGQDYYEYYLEMNDNDPAFMKKYPEFSQDFYPVYKANNHLDPSHSKGITSDIALAIIALDKVNNYINESPDYLSLYDAISKKDKNSLAWYESKLILEQTLSAIEYGSDFELPVLDWNTDLSDDNNLWIDAHLGDTQSFVQKQINPATGVSQKYSDFEHYVEKYTGIRLSDYEQYVEARNNETELAVGLERTINNDMSLNEFNVVISDINSGRVILSEEFATPSLKESWELQMTEKLLENIEKTERKILPEGITESDIRKIDDSFFDWSGFTEEDYNRLNEELIVSINNGYAQRSTSNLYGSVSIGELCFEIYDEYYDNPRGDRYLNFDGYKFNRPEKNYAADEVSNGTIHHYVVLNSKSYEDFKSLIEKKLVSFISSDIKLFTAANEDLLLDWNGVEAEQRYVQRETYKLYLQEWEDSHPAEDGFAGMEPASYEEFLDNEFREEEYINSLIENYAPKEDEQLLSKCYQDSSFYIKREVSSMFETSEIDRAELKESLRAEKENFNYQTKHYMKDIAEICFKNKEAGLSLPVMEIAKSVRNALPEVQRKTLDSDLWQHIKPDENKSKKERFQMFSEYLSDKVNEMLNENNRSR